MTPGPYHMDGLNIIGADGCVVATMNKPSGDLSSTAYADGRLFVAAPDLLQELTDDRDLLTDLLEWARAFTENGMVKRIQLHIASNAAVLAKAEGRS